ncbi:hypothetical protein SLE2022_200520 [Rubroshorea leprosula]
MKGIIRYRYGETKQPSDRLDRSLIGGGGEDPGVKRKKLCYWVLSEKEINRLRCAPVRSIHAVSTQHRAMCPWDS